MWKNRLCALALTLGIGAAPASAGTPFPTDLFGGPFELERGSGAVVTDTDLHGGFALIYFGYTFCPDICPTDLSRIAEAYDGLTASDRAKLQPLFITVDPERDTPDLADEFAQAFHDDFIGLSGSPEAVGRAVSAFRVHRAKVYVPGEPEEEYLVSHSPNVYLMGPAGEFLTLFPFDTPIETMTETLRRYLAAAGT